MLMARSVLSILFLFCSTAPAFAQFVSSENTNSFLNLVQWIFIIFLANPNGCYLLLLLGFYALLYEFTHGGFGLSGLIGIVLLSLAVVSFKMLPLNWLALILVVIAIGLFLWEAFMPGNGTIIVAGIFLMGIGSLYLFPPMRIAYSVVFILTLLTAFLTIFLVRSAIRAQGAKIISGKEGMIGLKGEVWSDIAPGKAGKVSAQGTLWNAVSDETISKGEAVEIVSVDGMVLKVKKVLPEQKGG